VREPLQRKVFPILALYFVPLVVISDSKRTDVVIAMMIPVSAVIAAMTMTTTRITDEAEDVRGRKTEVVAVSLCHHTVGVRVMTVCPRMTWMRMSITDIRECSLAL
jgi:hypothetical protein